MFILKYWKFALFLAGVLILSFYIEFRVQGVKEQVRLEYKAEQQQNYIETRKKVDNATKDVRGIESDAALEWLRNRRPSSTE